MLLNIKNSSALRIDIDVAEKIILAIFFAFFAVRMLSSYIATGNFVNLLFFGNELVVLLFVVFRRRAKNISRRSSDWLLGFAGTCLPLLLMPAGEMPLVPPALCGVLILLGFAINMSAKLTLRRSFGIVAANRGVKTSGPYRIVRHPMYAGYMISQAAFFLSGPTLVNGLLIACAWALQIGRILAEERVLAEDENYRVMMHQTRYRLVPGLF